MICRNRKKKKKKEQTKPNQHCTDVRLTFEETEAAVRRCSSKKVFLKHSQKNTYVGVSF